MTRYVFELDGRKVAVDVEQEAPNRFRVTLGERTVHVRYLPDADLVELEPPSPAPHASAVPSSPSKAKVVVYEVRAPIPGTIISVEVQPGQEVAYGDPLLVLEAMKMKNLIRAPRSGRIAEVLVQPGQSVKHNDLLIRFEASS